jgi:hypothetical protein
LICSWFPLSVVIEKIALEIARSCAAFLKKSAKTFVGPMSGAFEHGVCILSIMQTPRTYHVFIGVETKMNIT